jgi:hypothetical protein
MGATSAKPLKKSPRGVQQPIVSAALYQEFA